jgi:ABC-type transport system involved in multi-copper enzyme maturation permease subunit
MSARSILSTIRWLVRDTLSQALASGVFWCMVALSVAATLFCITAKAPADGAGYLQLGLGSIQISADEGLSAAVRTVQAHLASWVADVAGLLLALLWTAGFLPGFLDASAAAVLLAKPAPRWVLLAGKFTGVLAFVGLQVALFVVGTWFALGIRTGVWDGAYLLCVPLLVLHFAIFFSFSAMLAVATRSSVACVFGSLLFWVLCWGMNFGRHAVHLVPELHGLSGVLATTTEVGYWVLPKPLDFQLLLSDGLRPGDVVARLVSTSKLVESNAWSPIASVLASTAVGLALFAVTAYDFIMADY